MAALQNSTESPLRIAERSVDFERQVIQGPDGETRLEPKVMAVLAQLVEASGEVVSRVDLIDQIWGVEYGADDSVTRAVSLLRRALGDTKAEQRVIETIPKKGYRLARSALAPNIAGRQRPSSLRRWFVIGLAFGLAIIVTAVTVIYRDQARDRSVSGQAIGLPIKTRANAIAVLPFDDLSPGGDKGWFADGMAEEILNSLANIDELNVVARRSSFAFRESDKDLREIGETLHASFILEGSVRTEGEKVRVTAQMIDASTGFHIWSKTYDQELANIFEIQHSIASEIVVQLAQNLGVSVSAPAFVLMTDNFEAYAYFLRARQEERTGIADNLIEAVRLYKESIRLDPDFAHAYAGLADVYSVLPFVGGDGERTVAEQIELSYQFAKQAIEIDPHTSVAQTLLGRRYGQAGDWIAARLAYDKAVEIDPGSVKARYGRANHLLALGYIEDAVREFEYVAAIDPLHARYHGRLAEAYYISGDHDRALSEATLGHSLGHRMGWFPSLMIYAERGDYAQAEAVIERFAGLAEFDKAVQDEIRMVYRAVYDEQYQQGALQYLYDAIQDDAPTWIYSQSLLSVWDRPRLLLDQYKSPTDGPSISFWFPHVKAMRALPAFKETLRAMGYVDYWDRFGWPDICRPTRWDDGRVTDFKCR